MRNLDNLSYRQAAVRIIERAFPRHSPLDCSFRAEFLERTGEPEEAEKLYSEMVTKYGNTDQVPWLNLGNFYMSIKKYQQALDAYEKERAALGKRAGISESFPKSTSEYLERRIQEARDALEERKM